MYPYLISIVIILIMLISPQQEISNVTNTAAGKFSMIVFLILAIQYDMFLGLLVLVVMMSFMTSGSEGMAGMPRTITGQCPKLTSQEIVEDLLATKDPATADVTKSEGKVAPSSEKIQQNLNLTPQELEIIRELIRTKQRDPKAKCRRNCGNALLTCLDGCQVSEQMRRPVSSKELPVNTNTTNMDNIEPANNQLTEGFTSFA